MPKPVPLPPLGFDELSVDEKIDYLQSLWDRIAASPDTIPVPDWHREILEESRAAGQRIVQRVGVGKCRRRDHTSTVPPG